jgi:HAMP domain-containing protein
MTLRTRMILLISLLLAGSVLVTTALLTNNVRESMLEPQQGFLLRQATQAALAAIIILFIGAVASLLLSRAVTRPVISLERAANSVKQGGYQPDLLSNVVTRTDEFGELGRVFDQMAREVSARDQRLKLLKVIIPLGVSLSAEKDFNRLLETIVVESQRITRAEGGSLYLRTEDEKLKFVILRNEPLGIALGGTSGNPVTFTPVPMDDENGEPNHSHVASHCALTGERVSIKNAYESTEFDFAGTRAFDAQTGFHSQSFMTIPLKDTTEKVIGVLQLLNARTMDGEVIPFAEDEVLDSIGLITSAALSAYIREEGLRQEIDKLRIEIDLTRQTKQVQEIAESDYFQQLQMKAQLMKQKRMGNPGE